MEALGLYTYLTRLFESYEESALGTFMTDEVKLTAIQTDTVETYTITMKSWLAPYDMGVSQRVTLSAAPAEMEHNLYAVWVDIERESGDVDSWQRLNRRFLNTLRKQFLIWRTVDQGVKDDYTKEGRIILGVDTAVR